MKKDSEADFPLYIGCAGWNVPTAHAAHFPNSGTHLERYAVRFSAVEINSSFYRPHRPATYAKWAACVPAAFRFAVKVPKTITHGHRLVGATEPLESFLEEVRALENKLGPLLVQLPPSLAFKKTVARSFFASLRERFGGQVVCEPRHASWFEAAADELLSELQIARVAADPAIGAQAATPGGWNGLAYFRLHGSPTIYRSPYTPEFLDALALQIRAKRMHCAVWCIFDNTAEGAATANALELQKSLR